MKYTYETRGVCAKRINFELDGNIVKNVEFEGGCGGNTQGISKLVEGMNKDEVIIKLKEIKCGMKSVSCPNQLAVALEQAPVEK